jgi:hypothetical protein
MTSAQVHLLLNVVKVIVPSTAHTDWFRNIGLMNDKHAEKVEHNRANSKIATSVERARDTLHNACVSTWKVGDKEILLADIALEDEQRKTLEEACDEEVAG